jgi:hypothetical protein
MSATSLDLSQIKTDALSAAASFRTLIGLGTLATQSPTGTPSASTFLRGDYSWQTIDLFGYQPLDSDLTAIAALATTSFGRGLLTETSASTARTTLGLGTLATQSGTFSGTSSGTNTGDQDLSGLLVKASNLSDLTNAATARTNLGLGTGNTPTFLGASLTGGTVTASTPLINATQTWNSAGTVFTGILANVTDTASDASSLLMDLQTGGVSQFRVAKNGRITIQPNGGFSNAPVLFFGSSASINSAASNAIWFFDSGGEARPMTQFESGSITMGSVGSLRWSPNYPISGASDLFLFRDAANTLAQRNAGNAQTFRIYESFTDASNYTRGSIAATSSGFDITPEAAGTGSKRPVRILGHSLASSEAVSALEINQTWNTTGIPTLIKANVTDTASSSSSLLMDLQVGGSSRFQVLKTGPLRLYSSVGAVTTVGVGTFNGELTITNGQAGYFNGNNLAIQLRSDGYFGWSSTTTNDGTSTIDTRLYRDSANTLAQRNATNAQTFRIYNTFTDASNYERGKLEWASNEFRIGTEAAGTGTVRTIRLQAGTATAFYYEPVAGNIGIGTPSYGSTVYFQTIAIGTSALADTSANNGNYIVAIGSGALRYLNVVNTSDSAVSVGRESGNRLRAAAASVLVGGFAGWGASSFTARITNTTCLGYEAGAGFNSTTITDNTCIGYRAGFALSTGSNNTLLGSLAGDSITTGQNNIAIGRDCDVDSATASNQINIGNQYYHNRAFLYNTFTDASNYERLKLEWASNVLQLGTEKGSAGGSARALELQTDGVTRLSISAAGAVTIGAFTLPTTDGTSGQVLATDGSGVATWQTRATRAFAVAMAVAL